MFTITAKGKSTLQFYEQGTQEKRVRKASAQADLGKCMACFVPALKIRHNLGLLSFVSKAAKFYCQPTAAYCTMEKHQIVPDVVDREAKHTVQVIPECESIVFRIATPYQ